MLVVESLLVGEDQFLHLPEFTLPMGGFGGGRRARRLRMEAERQVLEDHPHLVAISVPNLLQRRLDAGAEGTLEIHEFHQGDFGVGLATHGRTVHGDGVALRWVGTAAGGAVGRLGGGLAWTD